MEGRKKDYFQWVIVSFVIGWGPYSIGLIATKVKERNSTVLAAAAATLAGGTDTQKARL